MLEASASVNRLMGKHSDVVSEGCRMLVVEWDFPGIMIYSKCKKKKKQLVG